MKLRRGWFGNLNFTIGLITSGVCLYMLILFLCEHIEMVSGVSVYLFYVKLSLIASVCLFIIFALVFFLITFLKNNHTVKTVSKKAPGNIIFRCLFAVMAIALCASLYFSTDIYSLFYSSELSDINILYLDFLNGTVSLNGYFLKNLYSLIFVNLFKIFGCNWNIIFIVNAIFIFAGAVFISLFTKNYIGRTSSVCVMLASAIFTYFYKFIYDFSGLTFVFFICGFVLYLLSLIFDKLKDKRPVLSFVISILVILGLFSLYHFGYCNFDFKFVFNDKLVFYTIPESRLNLSLAVLVALLVFYGFLSYLFSEKDNISLINIVFVLISFVLFFDYSEDKTYLFFLLCVASLAGIGIRSLFEKRATDKSKSVITEESKEEPAEFVPLVVPKVEVPKEAIDEATVNETSVIKQKPKLLHNPLPGPKPHVKKTIEYSFEPDAKFMKYDVEITDNDDFDI